jgi:hypothetical protein
MVWASVSSLENSRSKSMRCTRAASKRLVLAWAGWRLGAGVVAGSAAAERGAPLLPAFEADAGEGLV